MPLSRECDSPINIPHPIPSLSEHPLLEQVSDRTNELNIAELGVQSQMTGTSPPPPFITDQHRPPSLMRASSYPPVWIKSIGFEGLAITAGAIITIQLQMLTSGSMATTMATRVLLFFGMTFELLAILLAICFIHSYQYSEGSQRLPVLVRLASGMPIVFILMGIVGLATALVVEMLKTSLGTAVAMSGFLIFGIILCLLASFFRTY